MSYIVEQKIKGRIYLYEVTNRWDKEKKQSRQKRKYLGPKERIYKAQKTSSELEQEMCFQVEKNKLSTKSKPSDFVSKDFGDVFLIEQTAKNLGLDVILQEEFSDDYKEILALANFMLTGQASYLFPYWKSEHYLEKMRVLSSDKISALYEKIGRDERKRMNFLKKWVKHLNPRSGIYYDITSISSYSDNIEFVDWGYNRDKEILPQINLGITYCSEPQLPALYNTYPGSIVDVSTLKNMIKIFDIFELDDVFYILDRGFCSIQNMLDMRKNSIKFIQPLSMTLTKTKEVIAKNRSKIKKFSNVFEYNGEIIHHLADEVEFEQEKFKTHVFFNEKIALECKNNLYKTILEIEKFFVESSNVGDFKEFENFVETKIPVKFQKFFSFEKEAKKIIQNEDEINKEIDKSGYFIFVVEGKNLDREKIIELYRNRDTIEKDIDLFKNQVGGNRLRSHHKDTANGQLFVKFISTILATAVMQKIKQNKDTKYLSLNETLAEVKKLKIQTFDHKKIFLTEITKKQKKIFHACNINPNIGM